jgi:hypothetical protein
MARDQNRDSRRVGVLKLLFILLLLIGLGVAELAPGEQERIWVDGGDNTITFEGKVTEVTDTEVVMEVENSASGYYEGGIGGYNGENPVTFRRDAIFASRHWEKERSTKETPGFSAILAVVGILCVGIGRRKK